MKEMVGGCCVCSDERGWPDNPLVYCDGNGCTVAVHQACYGIVTVPTGPWFCRKCESPEKQSKVKCELCPSRSGALKRSDNGGWAHVVCALYIPEVRFGNVTSMEPIILQLIPPERFNKSCYICHESSKINRSTIGACMQCNKSGCKQQFHVTCAQSLGLLCEEAGNYLDNVKYCGYCRHHYSKLKKGGNVKTIPPYKPVSQDSPSSDSGPEKEPEPSPANSSAEVVPSPSTSGLSKASTSKSGSGRKSGQGSSTTTKGSSSDSPSTSTTLKISPQSKSNPSSKVATPQAKNSEKSTSKKTPPPGESQRRASSSATETVVSNTNIVTPTVSPVGASSQSNRAKSTPLSPSNNKIPPNQQEPIVVINGIRVTSPASNSTATSTVTSQQNTQKYTSPSFTETVITSNESSFNSAANSNSAETKQTKKRKAVSQAAAAGSYPPSSTITAPPPQPVENSNTMQWEPSTQPTDLTPDSSSEDKTKKMRTDGTHVMPAVITKPPASSASGSSTIIAPLDDNAGQQVTYSSASQQPSLPGPSPSQTPVISTDKHSSRLPSPAPPVTQISNTANAQSTIRSVPSNVPPQTHKYPNLAPVRPDEQQSSLVVSVPLPQASQPSTSHSAHQKPSTSAAAMSDAVFVEPATPPVSNSWGLRVCYEPQAGQSSMMDHTEDLRRQRAETLELCKPSVIQVDDKSVAGTSGIRNKKRSPIPSPQIQMPAPMPGTSGTSSYHVPTHSANMSRGVVKRGTPQPLPPPSAPMAIPSTSSQQHQEIQDSPPSSPGISRNIKSSLDRMGRAHHMLGNELNPESAAAARLSEQLNAELAAHSVFRAPSPAVPPPLINKASSARQSNNSSSGPQSLDQLLERQWEQGSQFLMEQAQHFDIASLLSCLHQLRTENVRLEEHVNTLVQRRDHLLAVNARLAIPFSAGVLPPEPAAPPALPPPPRPHNGGNVRQQISNVDGMMDGRSQQLIREPQRKSS